MSFARAAGVALALAASALVAVPVAVADEVGGLDASINAWGLTAHDPGGAPDSPPALGVAPGGEATLPLFVSYDAPSTTAGPVTVQVTLPQALQFVRAEAVVPEGQGITARWVCASQAPQVSCELRNAAGTEPFPLQPEHSARRPARCRCPGRS